jgi:CRISPR-associated protein Cas1
MKKHLNTLFVTTQGAYLAKEGEAVCVKIDGQAKLKVPIHTLDGIVCFGQVSMSPFLMGHCAEKDVAVSFMTEYGKFLARVQGPASGNVLLRREQYRRADDPAASATMASAMVTGKLANARGILRRAARDHPDRVSVERLDTACSRITQALERASTSCSIDEIRGLEGEAGNMYFGVFDELCAGKEEGFSFNGRSRRPPLDRVNCLLSFVYTLLMHDVRSALESMGLDPQVGFLHRDRPGRPGLALDMMEEFRPSLADRMVLSLVNLGQVKRKGFRETESGAVLMDDDTRKTVLVAWQNRKREGIMHPYLKEKMHLGHIFYIQAQLLARHLRGDLDGYPPFIWR